MALTRLPLPCASLRLHLLASLTRNKMVTVVVAVVDVCCLVTSNKEQSRGISSRGFYSLVASHWKRDVDNSNIAKVITKVN